MGERTCVFFPVAAIESFVFDRVERLRINAARVNADAIGI